MDDRRAQHTMPMDCLSTHRIDGVSRKVLGGGRCLVVAGGLESILFPGMALGWMRSQPRWAPIRRMVDSLPRSTLPPPALLAPWLPGARRVVVVVCALPGWRVPARCEARPSPTAHYRVQERKASIGVTRVPRCRPGGIGDLLLSLDQVPEDLSADLLCCRIRHGQRTDRGQDGGRCPALERRGLLIQPDTRLPGAGSKGRLRRFGQIADSMRKVARAAPRPDSGRR